MSKSRDIADSAATINYIDTVTSNVQDQIDNIDPLPSQTGNNGLFLTTDGSTASWAEAGGITLESDVAPGNINAGTVITLTITNFDSYETYTISTDNGTISRVAETITWTPSTVGSASCTINGRTISGYTVVIPAGQVAFTAAGTYSWTAPAGVTSVSVVAVGGGGYGGWYNTGGGGGALGYKNNIAVIPGTSYTVVVGGGGTSSSVEGGASYFIDITTLKAEGGQSLATSPAATYVGDGGGNGGTAAAPQDGGNNDQGGAGGAGGYSGNGGNAGNPPQNGSGGGGAGGYNIGTSSNYGGGVGILGEGSSGTAPSGNGSGGSYGAGRARNTAGVGGAVRIIWSGGSGITRAFPSTNTGDL